MKKTGFPLEHRTASSFVDSGWHIVSNKFYVDDSSGEAREIDLIAYKATKVEGILVYSAVVISCKKTSENKWVFMTRESNPQDLNKDWNPLHYWTNEPVLSYCLTKSGFSKSFATSLSKKSPNLWGLPKVDIFGFQELSPIVQSVSRGQVEISGYKPSNDKAIYSSITSLMKAQAYELGRLPDRIKEPRIYVFSLLSVMDGDMVEVCYDTDPPKLADMQIKGYIAHYIIKNTEQYCRINFVHRDYLKEIISEYDKSHQSVAAELKKAITGFYKDVFKDRDKILALRSLFVSKILVYLNVLGGFRGEHRVSDEDVSLDYSDESKTVQINIMTLLDDEKVDSLNGVDALRERAKKLLKDIYRYEGPFEFAADVPF